MSPRAQRSTHFARVKRASQATVADQRKKLASRIKGIAARGAENGEAGR